MKQRLSSALPYYLFSQDQLTRRLRPLLGIMIGLISLSGLVATLTLLQPAPVTADREANAMQPVVATHAIEINTLLSAPQEQPTRQLLPGINPVNLSFVPLWLDATSDKSKAVAWGDIDNDGDLDLAVSNAEVGNAVYRNHNGLEPFPIWSSNDADTSLDLA